jgi:SAM-dependent methyltransferase
MLLTMGETPNTVNIRRCPLCGAQPVLNDDICPGSCGSLEGMMMLNIADDDDWKNAATDQLQEKLGIKQSTRRLFGYDWANGYVAPYLGISKVAALNALKEANVGPKDTVVDLGCGDGIICLQASSLGAKAEGYDLDENLINKARKEALQTLNPVTPQYFVTNLFDVDLKPFSVITMFLLPETTSSDTMLDRLKRALDRKSNTRIISFGWPIPELGKPKAKYSESRPLVALTERWFVYGNLSTNPKTNT